MIALLLLLIPIAGSLAALFLKSGKQAFQVTLIFSALGLALSIYAAWMFCSSAGSSGGFIFSTPWVKALGISFALGLDGLSLLLVVLCNLLVFLIALSTEKHAYEKPNIFYALVLFMQAGMLGVFMARDGFLFYVAWETALIPIYFICSLYGGENRIKVTLKFFIYTILGSLFMLAAIIYLYIQTPERSFSLSAFYALNLDKTSQTIVFIAFYLAFAIKMPIFPLHTWQPDTYVEAPAHGTMLLSGIMLKMGIYGFLRWVLPVVPGAFNEYGFLVIILCVSGLVYSSIIAFMQKDMKRLLAYSSIAHVALIGAAVFAANGISLQGAVIQMFSHGINITGLFFIVFLIEKQTGTRFSTNLSGLAYKAPVLAVCFAILVLGSIALPLTNGFPGEFLMLNGLFRVEPILSAIAGLTIIFGAVYMLKMYQKVMLGPEMSVEQFSGLKAENHSEMSLEMNGDRSFQFTDISGTDKVVLLILAGLVILLGIWPAPLLKLTEPAVRDLLLQAGQFHQHIQ